MKRLLVVCAVVLTWMASPCFAIEYCKDFLESGNSGGWSASLKTFDDEWTMGVGDEVSVDIWINDVPINLLTAGFYIQYDPSKVSIVSVDAYDANDLPGPWEADFTLKYPDVYGTGTYLLTVATFATATPDGDGDIILGKVRFRCESEGDATVTISTISGTDTIVGDSTVFDGQIASNNVVIHQQGDNCDGDFDDDGDQDGTDAAVFKSDFGRSPFSNPCPNTTTTTITTGGCPYGMVDCGDKCVDPMTDEDYCGASGDCLGGTACVAGEICDVGVCVFNCPGGQINCGGQCINTDTDEVHCGGCFNPCGSGELCVAGKCEIIGDVVYQAAVEKTGQTICSEGIDPFGQIDCTGTGQDGEYQKGVAWPNPRFTDNGDGTVTDNLTGLIWLQNANCFGNRTWNNALSDSNGLESGECGLTDGSSAGDWRLPNINELASLVHKGYYSPTVPNTTGTGHWSEGDPFNNVQPTGYYWSSTSLTYTTDSARTLYMGVGSLSSFYKNHYPGWFVLPVRGGH